MAKKQTDKSAELEAKAHQDMPLLDDTTGEIFIEESSSRLPEDKRHASFRDATQIYLSEIGFAPIYL